MLTRRPLLPNRLAILMQHVCRRGLTEIGVLYVCPQRDYSLVREVVAVEWPICPNDGTPLERYAG